MNMTEHDWHWWLCRYAWAFRRKNGRNNKLSVRRGYTKHYKRTRWTFTWAKTWIWTGDFNVTNPVNAHAGGLELRPIVWSSTRSDHSFNKHHHARPISNCDRFIPPAHDALHLSNSSVLQENWVRSGSVVTDVGTEYSYVMPGFFSSPNRRACQTKKITWPWVFMTNRR